MDGIGELIFIQLIYIVVLFFIIRTIIKEGKKGVFYWIIVGLYLLTIVWLITEFIKMPKIGNGGYGFVIGMYSIIIPAVLTVIALLVFVITQIMKKTS